MTEAPPNDPHIASAMKTLATERAGLDALQDALANGLGAPFHDSVRRILAIGGRVIVTGMGKSGLIARKIAATLASTGTPAMYVHPGEASHGDLGMIQNGDVVLALSWSGETSELSDIIAYSRRFGVVLIGLTATADSTLATEADLALVLPRAAEACPNGLAPTTSTTMMLAFGDALAVALLEARGFSAADFSVFHPGGKLGARLRQVGQLMHRGETLPVVRRGALMAETLLEMSAKGFGCAIVVEPDGTLAGIVTDGDLRRHMRPDLAALPVDAVMTASPITVPPSLLAVEALQLIETSKRAALIVVEGQRPVGLIRVLDLLAAGVA